MDKQQDHPLHGVGLEAMLLSLVKHYDWEILAAQIPLKCFDSYPSVKSSIKFLKKTRWARERVEAFYLYRYKNLPLPSDEQHELPPRERDVDLSEPERTPAIITLSDREFFDDPVSGPKKPSGKFATPSRRSKPRSEPNLEKVSTEIKSGNSESGKIDPWAKAREKKSK